jgi:ABC-type nitrate/sulfonate/bicarbonate transport system ATPase subunit
MFYKRLTLINTVVATTALMFQVTVLYPWHKDISNQITQIKEQQKKCKSNKRNKSKQTKLPKNLIYNI